MNETDAQHDPTRVTSGRQAPDGDPSPGAPDHPSDADVPGDAHGPHQGNGPGNGHGPEDGEGPGEGQGPDDGDALRDAGDGPPGRRRLRRLAPWVLVALAVAVAAVSTWQWQQLAAAEQARDEVAERAGSFMLTLTDWDATDGMGSVREELAERGTERFAGEVDELFGTTEDLADLADIGARSEGDVRRLFVQELEDGRAVALVVLVQRIVTDVTEGEEVSTRYAEVELLRHDDVWLVDDVELLVDVAQQEAQPVAPEGREPPEDKEPGDGIGDGVEGDDTEETP